MQYSADQIVNETGGVSLLRVKTDMEAWLGLMVASDETHFMLNCILYTPEVSDNDRLSKYHQTSWKTGYY